MPELRALIVDDEPLSRANIRLALADHPAWVVAGECASIEDARQALRQGPAVDAVFLDVQLPQESGMVLARELAQQPSPPVIVFVTAYQHYAVQAFEFHALDYLLKPFDDARFGAALARLEDLVALRRAGAAPYAQALQSYVQEVALAGEPQKAYLDRICVRSVGQMETVWVHDIVWIGTSGNYVELHLPGRVVLHRSTLRDILVRLDPTVFLQVHRCAAVRKTHCQALRVVGDGTYLLTMNGAAQVPVSERYVAGVRALLA